MHTSNDIPEIEPTTIRAGETVKWTKDLSEHYTPAGSWALTYFISGPKQSAITATASSDNQSYSVTISATETASWPAGSYWWQARVIKSGEVFTVGGGSITVLADVTQLPDGYDGRSTAKKILDAHESAYLAYAGRIEKQYSVGTPSRSFVYHDKAELIAAINYWKGIVAQEVEAEKIARGEGTGRNIFVRFGSS